MPPGHPLARVRDSACALDFGIQLAFLHNHFLVQRRHPRHLRDPVFFKILPHAEHVRLDTANVVSNDGGL